MFHHQTPLRRPSGARWHRMCHCPEAELHGRAQQAQEVSGEATGTLSALSEGCIIGRMRKLLLQIKGSKETSRLEDGTFKLRSSKCLPRSMGSKWHRWR